MNKHTHAVINNRLDIMAAPNGDFVLSDIRTDKDTKEVYLVTRAVYQNEINLVADVVNFFVNRAVFFKSITTIDEMKKESAHVAEICRSALGRLHKSKGEQQCRI